jgi:hypothetical protein
MDALVTKYSFFCFCATLAAIVLLYSLGALLAWSGRPAEASGDRRRRHRPDRHSRRLQAPLVPNDAPRP